MKGKIADEELEKRRKENPTYKVYDNRNMRVFHAKCYDCPWNTFDVEGFGEQRTIKAQEFHSLMTGHSTELFIEDMELHKAEVK